MNASVAITSAQGHLNDPSGSIFTFALLKVHLQNAHRDLQLQLYLNGLPILRQTSNVIPIPATANPFYLGADLGLLPFDFIQLIPEWAIRERDPGGTMEDFVPLEAVDFIPDEDPDVELRWYSDMGSDIRFVGCTAAREIYLRYTGGIPIPYAPTDPLGFVFAETFLGPMTAAYQYKSLGNKEQYIDLKALADSNIDTVIRANVRGNQRPTRRRGYQRKFGGGVVGHV